MGKSKVFGKRPAFLPRLWELCSFLHGHHILPSVLSFHSVPSSQIALGSSWLRDRCRPDHAQSPFLLSTIVSQSCP